MTEFAGLDDLLDRGARDSAGRRSRSHLRWALKAAVASAALAAALVVVLIVLGFRLSYLVAVAGMFAALILHRVVVGVRAPGRSLRVDNLEREPGQGNRDGLWPAVHRWHVRLGRKRALQPSLAELVDERLRQRHGFTRAEDPDRARTLLGERLWSYLADPAARTPSPRALAAMLTTVEEL